MHGAQPGHLMDRYETQSAAHTAVGSQILDKRHWPGPRSIAEACRCSLLPCRIKTQRSSAGSSRGARAYLAGACRPRDWPFVGRGHAEEQDMLGILLRQEPHAWLLEQVSGLCQRLCMRWLDQPLAGHSTEVQLRQMLRKPNFRELCARYPCSAASENKANRLSPQQGYKQTLPSRLGTQTKHRRACSAVTAHRSRTVQA